MGGLLEDEDMVAVTVGAVVFGARAEVGGPVVAGDRWEQIQMLITSLRKKNRLLNR
jgi:hypothetical protein